MRPIAVRSGDRALDLRPGDLARVIIGSQDGKLTRGQLVRVIGDEGLPQGEVAVQTPTGALGKILAWQLQKVRLP